MWFDDFGTTSLHANFLSVGFRGELEHYSRRFQLIRCRQLISRPSRLPDIKSDTNQFVRRILLGLNNYLLRLICATTLI